MFRITSRYGWPPSGSRFHSRTIPMVPNAVMASMSLSRGSSRGIGVIAEGQSSQVRRYSVGSLSCLPSRDPSRSRNAGTCWPMDSCGRNFGVRKTGRRSGACRITNRPAIRSKNTSAFIRLNDPINETWMDRSPVGIGLASQIYLRGSLRPPADATDRASCLHDEADRIAPYRAERGAPRQADQHLGQGDAAGMARRGRSAC